MTDPPRADDQHPVTETGETSPAPAARGALGLAMFACEIAAFVVLAVWGAVSWPFPGNVVAAIVTPAAAVLVWALFVSPRAVLAVHPFIRAVVELLVFGSAGAALWAMGLFWLGVAYAVVAVTVGALAGRSRLA